MAKTSNSHPKELPPLLLLVILTPPQPAPLYHLSAPASLHQHLCTSTSASAPLSYSAPLNIFTTLLHHLCTSSPPCLCTSHLCISVCTSTHLCSVRPPTSAPAPPPLHRLCTPLHHSAPQHLCACSTLLALSPPALSLPAQSLLLTISTYSTPQHLCTSAYHSAPQHLVSGKD